MNRWGRNRNAFKHGNFSAEAIAERRLVRELLRQYQDALDEVY